MLYRDIAGSQVFSIYWQLYLLHFLSVSSITKVHFWQICAVEQRGLEEGLEAAESTHHFTAENI
jgi:hypothetical protein